MNNQVAAPSEQQTTKKIWAYSATGAPIYAKETDERVPYKDPEAKSNVPEQPYPQQASRIRQTLSPTPTPQS